MNMSEIPIIGNLTAGAAQHVTPTVTPVEVVAPEASTSGVAGRNIEAQVTTDRVEFSQHAQLLEKVPQMPEVRQDKIDTIREAIENNTYLTSDKLDLAVSRMIDELLG